MVGWDWTTVPSIDSPAIYRVTTAPLSSSTYKIEVEFYF